VVQAAGMVGVQVRQHHLAHVAGGDPERAQPRPDLLLGRDPLAQPEAEERVPAREVPGL
jgi:hypothetical protein